LRIYSNFPEAQNEIARDLAELGVRVQPETMQDKQVADDTDFLTRELTNYIYTVLNPDYTEVQGTHDAWVKQEWIDRVTGGLNPGRAWKERKEVWEEFLEIDGKKKEDKFYSEDMRNAIIGRFAYTYSKRMGGDHIEKIIEELDKHPNSRQLYLPVWNVIDETRRGQRRVPCSLGYWLVQRGGKVHLTYMMRSCDLMTHYSNDVALATMLLHHVANSTDYEVGTFTHFVGSLHVYAKDVEDVF
jgi:thymidylate synthase